MITITRMTRIVQLAFLALFAGIALGVGYNLVLNRISTGIYREKLAALSADYAELHARYQELTKRTAITELVVTPERVTVAVVDASGQIATVETPFDPEDEIYVDYANVNSRLWIRRVYSDRTPPEQGVVIDPALADIDWKGGHAAYGKAIYRQLQPGRWIVTVTGGGALELEQSPYTKTRRLQRPPSIVSYPELENAVRTEMDGVGFFDVLRYAFGSFSRKADPEA